LVTSTWFETDTSEWYLDGIDTFKWFWYFRMIFWYFEWYFDTSKWYFGRQYLNFGGCALYQTAQLQQTAFKTETFKWYFRRFRRVLLMWKESLIFDRIADFDEALLVDADSRPRFKTRRILPDHVPEYATKYWRNTIEKMRHIELIFYPLFGTAEGRLTTSIYCLETGMTTCGLEQMIRSLIFYLWPKDCWEACYSCRKHPRRFGKVLHWKMSLSTLSTRLEARNDGCRKHSLLNMSKMLWIPIETRWRWRHLIA